METTNTIKNFAMRFVAVIAVVLLAGNAWGADQIASKTMESVVSENKYTVSAGTTIGTKCLSIDLDANINVSVNSSGNNGTFWGTSTSTNWRVYQGNSGTITITASNGSTLKSVTFTYTVDNSGVINTSGNGQSIASTYRVTSNSALSLTGTSKVLYVGNTSNKSNGQVRITQISVTYTPGASCTANPTNSGATLNGDFNNNGVTSLANITNVFSCSGSSAGSDCSYAENGFVWSSSASTASALQKGSSGVTYISGTTPNASGAFTGTLSGTWTANTTYYYRSYVKNNGGNIKYYPADGANSFTVRSVAFNSNGGSSVSTKYVRSGGTITNPGAPATAKTGYTFDSWRTDEGLGTAVNFSSAINASTTYYAKWNPKQCTITFDKEGGTGGSDNTTATYDAEMETITPPTRAHYIFGGYWDGDNGTGNQYYKADGKSNANWNKNTTSATTLYAKWTEKNIARYVTNCCTPLDQIVGAVTITGVNEGGANASWELEDHTGISKYTLNVYKADNSFVKSVDVTDPTKRTASIGGLETCTEYYVTITTVAANGYCAGTEQGKSENFTTHGWAVHYTGGDATEGAYLGNVTKLTGADQMCLSEENYVATFQASAGYKLPSTITVWYTGDVMDEGYTWNSATGTLTIPTAGVSEEFDVRIIGECITPNITADPANAVYALNDPATPLSVTVEGAGAWCGYQWQISSDNSNWSNIAADDGGTAATYTPSTASAGSTTYYRVIVSNIASGCSTSTTSGAATVTVSALAVCAQPEFSIAEGTKLGAQSVMLSCDEDEASIYYTTNGEDPEEIPANLYDGSAIEVNQTTTIKAIAAKSGMTTSAVVSATYTIQCKAPTFSVDEGTYNVTKSVELASEYGTVYYTLDGSDPATDGVAYSEAIPVTVSTTIRAIAKKANCENSEEASAEYELKCATPTFSVEAGDIIGAQNVELACATDGAAIHYTTDNSTPTGSSATYSSAIAVSSDQTIKAIATKDGWSNSDVASAAYTIKYTLTFQNNGVTLVSGGTKNLAPGEAYGTLPPLTADDACDATSTTFMGWSTANILEKQPAAPASYASATSVMGAGNVVLNAVWAKTKTPGVEPVSITSFATGTYYLIDIQGDHYYAMSGTGTSKVDGVDVTDYVSYNSTTKQITITDESHMTAAMKYTISGTTSAAKIYNANKSKWVSTQSSGTSFSDSEGNNVVTKNASDPRFAFSYAAIGTSSNRCILYRSSQSGFCNYATSNMNQSTYGTGYLWLVTVGSPAVYEDYLTSCCTDWSESAPAISYSTPDHWKAGDDDVAVSIASGTTYGAVSFESSDEDILTVDAETGAIHAVAMGTATVTATWAGGVVDAVRYCSASSSVEVSVSATITVSFDGNDATSGTMTDQEMYYNEATALKANTFSKDGYTFYGWAETKQKADAGNRDYEGGETVTFTTDKTLYAVWQTKVHNLTMTQPTVSEVAAGTITANGSTTSPTSIAYGTDVTLAASENSTALDGYVFENWSVSGITLADATENPVVFTMPDNDVAVAAVYHHYTWDLTGYTVTTAPETLYSNGDHFDKSSVVIKAGYERSDNSSTKQVTLDAAEWTAKLDGSVIANNYTFALADNGKTLTLWVDETKVGEDYVLTVNAIPTDHFVINIWTSEISPIADKTSAYSMPNLSDQTAGAAATCKDHNLFVGWVEELYKDEPEGHIVAANTAMTPSNKTYYAVWGKTGTITESISYGWEVGDSKDGWTINGTNTNSTYKNSGAKSGSFSTAGNCIKTSSYYASPKSIKAYVTKATTNTNTSNLFRLEYSATGADNSWSTIASSDDFSDMSRGVFEELSANLTSYTNKYFRIFFANASAEGLVDDVEFVYDIQGPVDYITDCVQRYQVTFNANGGTGSYDALEKKEGATVTLPDGSALSRAAEHYHFNGWKVYNTSTEEEISVSENQFTMPGAAVNAVAQWEEDPKGTVRYVGDEILNSSITRYAGQTYDLRTEVTLPAGRKLVGWMLEGDETLYAPGRTMTMPDPVQNITYNVQVIDQLPTPSGVSFSDGEWVLVTNTNQLSAGDFVVIVANGLTNAMGTQANTNRGIASVTKHNEGQTITLTENVAKLFLQYGYREGEFALYDMAENGYLYASSNTSNDLKTSATYSNRNYSWLITIGEGNIASIVAKGANSHNNLKYNTSASVFSSYASGQAAIQLYRYDGHKTVEITENVNASAIYLDDANVVVKDGKTLTIDIASDLDNLTVEVGGKVTNTNNLTVNDLTIKSEAGKSGQVTNGNKISVNGALYMDVTFFKGAPALTAETADRWYMISAPFDVNLSNGFCQVNGTPMVFGQDFDLFEYEGNKRAETGVTGWKRAQGKMNAGVACLIGFNAGQPTTIRLKAASTTLTEKTSITLNEYIGDADNQNWNGVANPTLHYTDISHDVQTYNNEDGENGRKYIAYTASSTSFVVGTAFFVQETGTMTLSAATHGELRAPKRAEADERYEACVRIFRQEATEFADQMYVRASETALSQYEQGHDMITWNGTTGNTAMIWAENYGKRLAIEEAPLVNDKASYELGIFAPQAGTYRIAMTSEDDAELYLTYNGRAIWNLSMSECELELAQGQNAGYGLRLVVKAPSVVTGIENSEVSDQKSGVQKVIIDEHVYILRGGQMYDVNGKMVK